MKNKKQPSMFFLALSDAVGDFAREMDGRTGNENVNIKPFQTKIIDIRSAGQKKQVEIYPMKNCECLSS